MEDEFEEVKPEGKLGQKVLYSIIEEKGNEGLRTKAQVKRVERYLPEETKRQDCNAILQYPNDIPVNPTQNTKKWTGKQEGSRIEPL